MKNNLYLKSPWARFVKQPRLSANNDLVDLEASGSMTQDKISESALVSGPVQ